MEFKYQIKTSVEQAVAHLRDMIISGELKQGMKIPEIEISKAMNISRTPIREAFRILEAEGLVRIAPNKGVTVSIITEKDLVEIYDLRMLLEVFALRSAWKKSAENVVLGLKNILKRMDRKIEDKDYVGYLKTSHEMHEYLLENCDNDRAFKLHQILRNNILAIHIFAYSYPEHSTDSIQEHRKVIEALENKDIDLAENLLKVHLELGLQRAKKFLKKL
jgi:DNA-binding GntR family transcriptional regulator